MIQKKKELYLKDIAARKKKEKGIYICTTMSILIQTLFMTRQFRNRRKSPYLDFWGESDQDLSETQ